MKKNEKCISENEAHYLNEKKLKKELDAALKTEDHEIIVKSCIQNAMLYFDERYREGFSKENPGLVSAYASAMIIDINMKKIISKLSKIKLN